LIFDENGKFVKKTKLIVKFKIRFKNFIRLSYSIGIFIA
jgi:hypothetical protein